MIHVNPVTKIVTMDEDEYWEITNHIKACEDEINALKGRMNIVESKVA